MSDQEIRPSGPPVKSEDEAAALHEAETRVDTHSILREHEVHDVSFRSIVFFALALVTIILIAIFALRWLAGLWSGQALTAEAQIVPVQATPPPAPGPGVEAVPSTTLKEVLTPQLERLGSYGWIDKNAGTLHLPIERAMTLMLDKGFAARDGEPHTFTLPPGYKLDGSGGQDITP